MTLVAAEVKEEEEYAAARAAAAAAAAAAASPPTSPAAPAAQSPPVSPPALSRPATPAPLPESDIPPMPEGATPALVQRIRSMTWTVLLSVSEDEAMPTYSEIRHAVRAALKVKPGVLQGHDWRHWFRGVVNDFTEQLDAAAQEQF